MAIESASYISQLDFNNPAAGDQRTTADDHLRLVKKAVFQTFPNLSGEVSVSASNLNYLFGLKEFAQTALDTLSTSLVSRGSHAYGMVQASGTLHASYGVSSVTRLSTGTYNVVYSNPVGTAIFYTILANPAFGAGLDRYCSLGSGGLSSGGCQILTAKVSAPTEKVDCSFCFDVPGKP